MFRALFRSRIKRSLRSKKPSPVILFTTITLACTVSLTPCYSQQIITDGNTATSLNTTGTVTDVTTTTIKGNNAFNSFSKFNVDTGNTVNLVVPDASDNLINIVNGSQTQINGVLNSIKQGNVGGNIFLANPNGIVVGTQGVINVGSLTAVTPTKDFTNNFFYHAGSPNDSSVSALLNATAPINVNASITNNGKINAITDVKLDSGSIINAGNIYTDAVFDTDIETGDIVNLNTLDYVANQDDLVFENGEITLKADNFITTEGNMIAGNEVVFVSEGFTISDSGNLTPQTIANIHSDVVINANYIGLDSNIIKENGDLSFESFYIESSDGTKIQVNDGNININARFLNYFHTKSMSLYAYSNRDTNKGNMSIVSNGLNSSYLSGSFVIKNDSVLYADNNLTIDSTMLDLYHTVLIAGEKFTINALNGSFDPYYASAKSLESNFLAHNASMTTNIIVGNLDSIYIDGSVLTPTEINFSGYAFGGGARSSGDINLINCFAVVGLHEGQTNFGILTPENLDINRDITIINRNDETGKIIAAGDINIEYNKIFILNGVTLSAENINIYSNNERSLIFFQPDNYTGPVVLNATNDINLNSNNQIYLRNSIMTAGNNINLNAQNGININDENPYSDRFNGDVLIGSIDRMPGEEDITLTANNDILLTSNTFDIAPTANITAGNEVVFTSEEFNISYTGNLTPQAIGNIDSDVVINANSYIGLNSNIIKENGDLSLKSNWVESSGGTKIQVDDGNINVNVNCFLSPLNDYPSLSLYAYSDGDVNNGNINIEANQNIFLNPDSVFYADSDIIMNSSFFNMEDTVLIAGNNLKLNANSGTYFIPTYLSAQSLESNFLAHNTPMTINNIGIVGNLDRIYIDGAVLTPTEINFNGSYFFGGARSSGDINFTGPYYLMINGYDGKNTNLTSESLGINRDITIVNSNDETGKIIAANNIYINSDSVLFNETANITAGNLLDITTTGNISKTGTPLTAGNLNLTASNIYNYLPLNVTNTTNINTTGNCLISGTTGALTANTGGVFYYNNVLANGLNVNAGGQINIDYGLVAGNVNLITTAAAIDGPAETMLGHFNDLDIAGNLSATATNGNIYYYGGSVGGNATFNSGEANDNRISTAIGRYRPLNIAGNLEVTSAGHMSFMEGSVGGNTTINATKMAGLFDVDLGGNLTANALAFGYFAGNCSGNIDVTAPMGILLGVGNLLNVAGNVTARSSNGPVVMLDGNISGNVEVETSEIINIGNFDEFVNTNYNYNGSTYNYTNLPVPVINSDLAIAGNLHLSGGDNIYVDLSRGNLSSDYINTSDGSAFINNTGGNIFIDYISAPETVSVTAVGDININTIDPSYIILKTTKSSGFLTVGKAYFSDNAILSGDYIFGDFLNTSSTPYSLNISGSNGSSASEVELQLISSSGIVINDIKSNKATFNVLIPDTELIIKKQDVKNFKINKIDKINSDDQLLGSHFTNDYIQDIVRQSTIGNTYSSISNRLNDFFTKNMEQQTGNDIIIEKQLESKLAKINVNYDLTDTELIEIIYELSTIYNKEITNGATEVEARQAVLKYLGSFNLKLSSIQKMITDRGLNLNLTF